ncbi:MAG: hypothetical protein Kow0040_21030 [Thermogutta sp.]
MAQLEDWIREACDVLDRSIRRGESRRVEDLLASHPGPHPAPELLLELIYTEFVARHEVGLNPDPEEYFARFPDLIEDLRELFFVHRIVHAEDEATGGLSESETDLPNDTAAGDRPEPITDDAPALAMLGRYALLEVIGEGATAKVYKARDTQLKRLVAVKTLARGDEAREGGPPPEAEAAASLRHPNIVQVYEVGEADDCRYVVMELLEGGTLADRRGRTWKPRQAARLVETLARAVQYAHDHGILHRDLKPGNVLLDHDGTPKISDFGLAVRLDRSQSASGEWLVGTPGYAAPEQIWGRPEAGSPAGDIYGLGAILYELLTGRPPFRGRNAMETMLLVKKTEPVSPQKLQPHLHRDLAVICLKCLEKDPGKRYPSAAALADDLRRFLEGHVITARPAGPLERAAKWFHRNRAVAMVGAAAVVLLVGFALTWRWYASRLEQEMHGKAFLAEVTARQEKVLRSQQDLARQQRYAEALSQAGELLADNPGAAEAVLHDPELCPEDLRDFAWRLLDRLASAGRKSWDLFPPLPENAGEAGSADASPPGDSPPLTPAAEQEDREIVRLAVSPDGRRLAVGCADGTLLLWDTQERKALAQTHLARGAATPAFSPDGSALAAAGEGAEVTLWSIPDLKLLRRWNAAAQTVHGLAFTGKGEGLLAATDAGLRAALRDEETGQAAGDAMRTLTVDLGTFVNDRRLGGVARPPFRPPRNFQPDLTCLAVDPEESSIFCGTGGGRSFLLSWPKLTLTAVFREFNGPVSAASFSPDGTLLAAASGSSVWLYQRRTGVSRYLREAHFRPIVALAFSADGKQLLTCGLDSAAKLWDVRTLAPIRRFTGQSGYPVQGLFAPDMSSIWTACRTVLTQWDLTHGEIPAGLSGLNAGVRNYLPSRQGKRLLLLEGLVPRDAAITLWDMTSGTRLATVKQMGVAPPVMTLSADGDWLAVPARERQIEIRDAETLNLRRTVTLPDAAPVSLILAHPTSSELWIADRGGRLYRCRIEATGEAPVEEVREPPSPAVEVTAMQFDPGGRRLALGTADGRIQVWDFERRTSVSTSLRPAPVGALAFSPDGESLAAAAEGSAICLFSRDLSTVDRWSEVPGFITSLAFTPDGEALISGTPPDPAGRVEIRVWNVASGRCHAVFPDFAGPIHFSAAGDAMFTLDARREPRIWPLE